MRQLIDFINNYTILDSEAINELKNCAKQEKYSKNQFILEPGQYCNKLWFIKSGMIRKFHLNDGKEITSWIHCENEICTSLTSYFHKSPSFEYIQACETTNTISIDRQNSEKLSQFPQFSAFSNKLLTDQLALIDLNSKQFSLMTALEKYNFLKSIAPNMFKRARLRDIASIMGITPETLSRIRRKE
jgi:CRP-like cAMP-binding protein